MSKDSQWCTIESDPGVFTSLIESFGVKNAEFSELWSLDEDSLRSLGDHVYGLIFLFKWQKKDSNEESSKCLTGDDIPENLFFAKQITTNACATQAILSIILNASNAKEEVSADESCKDIVLGPIISSLRSFTSSFPPDLRGEAISNSENIRTAHNSFARNASFLSDEKHQIAQEDDDVFHFIAYIPHTDRCVYELDGLQEGPIRVGSFAEKDPKDSCAWLSVARTVIQERIERYAASEIKFNLMAIVRDKRVELSEKLSALQQAGLSDDSEEIMHIQAQILSEQEKRKQWELENERRRHNYLPFCLELLKSLAESNKLAEITQKAKEKMTQKSQK